MIPIVVGVLGAVSKGFVKRLGRIGNQRKNQDHRHHRIVKICQNTQDVALYGWPEQTIPLSVSARNQTKDFWT